MYPHRVVCLCVTPETVRPWKLSDVPSRVMAVHRAGKRPSRVYGHATTRAAFLICGRHASNCATHNDATAVLTREWDRPQINVPLVIVDSPYRELSRPVIGYIRALPKRGPPRRRHGDDSRICRRRLVGAAPGGSWTCSPTWMLLHRPSGPAAHGAPSR
jgi:hypothetical protein